MFYTHCVKINQIAQEYIIIFVFAFTGFTVLVQSGYGGARTPVPNISVHSSPHIPLTLPRTHPGKENSKIKPVHIHLWLTIHIFVALFMPTTQHLDAPRRPPTVLLGQTYEKWTPLVLRASIVGAVELANISQKGPEKLLVTMAAVFTLNKCGYPYFIHAPVKIASGYYHHGSRLSKICGTTRSI